MDYSTFCTKNLEAIIDQAFALVPGQTYRIVSDDEEITMRCVIRVPRVLDGYITPFSNVDYDYKLAALRTVNIRLRIPLPEDYKIMYAYTVIAKEYEQINGSAVLNMRALIASYIALGDEALNYEY